jgi:DNA-binding GntR family transcriptional regulator
MIGAKPNNATTVRSALRTEILACQRAPGDRLVISELCQRYGVSLGAVREALSALEGEGLVVALPKRGFEVVGMSMAELHQLTEARVEVEGACLRLAAGRGGTEWEAQVMSALDRLAATPRKPVGAALELSEAWSQAHADFHIALVAACGNRVLLGVREQLFESSERYRRLSVPAERLDRDVAAEHRALADAMLARDPEHACHLMGAHLRRTAAILSDAVEARLPAAVAQADA